MEKFQNQYRIPSARASWWDYSANGAYFITICSANRKCLFGEITTVDTYGRASVQLSPIGEIVNNEWLKSFEIRNELFCDAFIIMPNRIHAVLRIENVVDDPVAVETHGRASLRGRPSVQPEPKRLPKSISSFVAGFKSSATKRINEYRNTPKIPVWQTRFHDHIVRNDGEYRRIVNYINNNPANWMNDRFNKL